jgi:hypothetical protein
MIVGSLAFALGSCGSSAPTTTTTTTTAKATTTTSPAGTAARCATSALEASASFGGTAAGSSYYTVSVKNTGADRCSLDGYPKYQFFGPSGAGGAGAGSPVPISVRNGGPSPSRITITPNSTADSIIVYSDVSSGGENCPSVASALLTPPGSSESIAFPISFSPCDSSVRVYPFGESGSESP